jgi:hypothetical protein
VVCFGICGLLNTFFYYFEHVSPSVPTCDFIRVTTSRILVAVWRGVEQPGMVLRLDISRSAFDPLH